MSTQHTTSGNAPQDDTTLEAISAWHDQQLQDADLAKTFTNDDAACTLAEAYQRLDDAILQALTCPADQQQAIIAGAVRRVQESRRPAVLHFGLQLVAGIAAAAVVVFAWRSFQAPHAAPIQIAQAADIAQPAVKDNPASGTSETPFPTRPVASVGTAERYAGNNSINLREITLVSAGPNNTRPAIASTATTTENSAVDSFVRHVWMVKDATDPLKTLRPMLPGQETVLDHWIKEDRESYRLQLTLNDRDLQGLVNQFDSLGYVLLSPDAPQPGLFRQGSFTERPVVYEVHFVEK